LAIPNKFTSRLRAAAGFVAHEYDPFAPQNLIKSRSLGFNWLFGRNHGCPRGFGMMLWGLEKSGKSLISNDIIANIHQTDPEAVVIKYNPEKRERAQLTPADMVRWGIDQNRLFAYDTSRPDEIFNHLSTDVEEMVKEGLKVRLVIIDPVTGIRGRRELEQETVMQHQIGDRAATIKLGLDRVRDLLRDHQIGYILTTHATPEMDRVEQMRGNMDKSTASNGVRHFAEYFINVARIKGKKGQQNLLEQELIDESRLGMDDGGLDTGHRIRAWMQANSFGEANRVCEFTFDYRKGIVNQHEEAFRLGLNWGIITKVNNTTYQIGDKKFVGKPATLKALAESPALQQQIVAGLISMEAGGTAPKTKDGASAFHAFQTGAAADGDDKEPEAAK
jgi:hypothetical protein